MQASEPPPKASLMRRDHLLNVARKRSSLFLLQDDISDSVVLTCIRLNSSGASSVSGANESASSHSRPSLAMTP